MIEARTLKGFRDFLPNDVRKRDYVKNILKGVFESYGFEPLETPALEYEEILTGKYGEEGDKLMYRFTDNGERKVALRYDQTVPLARVMAQYQNELPTPFKRYQMQNVWRAENTQKGRFREFLQCDIDTVGVLSPTADAEILATAYFSLQRLGFKDFKFLLNDRNVFKDVTKASIVTIDKLTKIGREKVIAELVDRGEFDTYENAEKVLVQIESTSPTPWIIEVIQSAAALGVPEDTLSFNPTLARGLDYYTSTIIEVEIRDYEAGSVGGGGRYNELVGMFSKETVPAVGFAFGFDRLIEAMDELSLFPDDLSTTKILVTAFSEDLYKNSVEIVNLLRNNNIPAELYLEASKMEKQIKYALKKGMQYLVVIGPDEAEKGEVSLKILASGQQMLVKNDLLVDAIKEL